MTEYTEKIFREKLKIQEIEIKPDLSKGEIIKEMVNLKEFAMKFDKSENVLIAIAWIGHKIDDASPKFEMICKEFNFEKKVIS